MIGTILRFWFEETEPRRWFAADEAFDDLVAARFTKLLEKAGKGAFDRWAETPEGALALVLLLDQFPRNIHRGRRRAYAFDQRARAVARRAIAAGHDRKLPPERRMFLYLPFEHSEDPEDQEYSVRLFEALGLPEQLDYAKRHRDVIVRFGRFPHRNAILGRISTPEEEAFLREVDTGF